MQKDKCFKNYNLRALDKLKLKYKNLKYRLEKINSHFVLFYDEKPVTSKYAPYEEAKRFIDCISLEREYSIAVFFGIASFNQVNYFLNKNKENEEDKDSNYKFAIVIEKDIQLFSMIYNEIKNKINDNIVFLIDEKIDFIINTLDNLIDEENAKNVLPVRHIRATSVTTEHKEYYDSIENIFYKLIKEKLMSFSTASYFSPIWARNILLNLKLNEANSVSSLKGILKNKIPILLLAAGSSIDNYIEKIKSLEKTHFIIAVSHALNTLIKNDIIPNIVITVDGGFYSSLHTLAMRNISEKKSKIKIVTTHTAYPGSINNFDKDNIFYFSHSESFEKILFDETTYFPMEGSVIMPALRFAIFLEPKYILLAGADFCYVNSQTHSKYSSIYDIYFNSQNKLNTFESKIFINKKHNLIECYDGVIRESDEKLLSYFRHFEYLISGLNSVEFYFLTKESGKLKNVKEYSYNNFNNLKDKIEIKILKEKINTEIFYGELKSLYLSIKNKEFKKARENILAKIISPMHTDNFQKDEKKYEKDFYDFFTEWFKSIDFY